MFLLVLVFGAVVSDSFINSQTRRIVTTRRLLAFVGQYNYVRLVVLFHCSAVTTNINYSLFERMYNAKNTMQ